MLLDYCTWIWGLIIIAVVFLWACGSDGDVICEDAVTSEIRAVDAKGQEGSEWPKGALAEGDYVDKYSLVVHFREKGHLSKYMLFSDPLEGKFAEIYVSGFTKFEREIEREEMECLCGYLESHGIRALGDMPADVLTGTPVPKGSERVEVKLEDCYGDEFSFFYFAPVDVKGDLLLDHSFYRLYARIHRCLNRRINSLKDEKRRKDALKRRDESGKE